MRKQNLRAGGGIPKIPTKQVAPRRFVSYGFLSSPGSCQRFLPRARANSSPLLPELARFLIPRQRQIHRKMEAQSLGPTAVRSGLPLVARLPKGKRLERGPALLVPCEFPFNREGLCTYLNPRPYETRNHRSRRRQDLPSRHWRHESFPTRPLAVPGLIPTW